MRMPPGSSKFFEHTLPEHAMSDNHRRSGEQLDRLLDEENERRASPVAIHDSTDEPELEQEQEQESDIPLDGRDEIGEAMIRDLPKRPEPTNSPSPSQSPPLHPT